MDYKLKPLIHELPRDEDEPIQLQCRHIKPDGIRCGSPSLRNEPFCYYHHTARRSGPRQPQVQTATARKSSTFDLPAPADLNERPGVQLAIALILHKIANNEIDPRRAGLLLYGLQIASGNLKTERPGKMPVEPQFVDELADDPTHGPLAPEAELEELGRSSSLKKLIHKLSFIKEDPKTSTHLNNPATATLADPPNPIPALQANTPPTLNRACRRKLRKLASAASQAKILGQESKPARSRPRCPLVPPKGD